MTGSVCSFFIFCFILLLHLYPRKGTENGRINDISRLLKLHLYPRKGTEGCYAGCLPDPGVAPLPPQGDGNDDILLQIYG